MDARSCRLKSIDTWNKTVAMEWDYSFRPAFELVYDNNNNPLKYKRTVANRKYMKEILQ